MSTITSSNVSRKASPGRGDTASTKTIALTIALPTAASSEPKAKRPYGRIKLAIDVHADVYVVARQIDNASPQRPRKFTPEEFLEYAANQLTQADEVYSCYEVRGSVRGSSKGVRYTY